MPAIETFRNIGQKHDVYRDKDCSERFCKSFRERTVGTINFKKKKMKLLKNEQLESYENAKICYICKEKFEDNMQKIKMFQSRRSLP